uniref:SH2 domain-containing protein n=1 Tax=Ciona savignyi TaxID=51511 RepID=H2Z7P4_CIOSA
MRDSTSNICEGEVRCFCAERSSYYWRKLNARSSTILLANSPVGSYLLRPSEHPLYDYSVSQKIPILGVTHIRIGRNESGFYFMDNDDSYAADMIKGFTCVVSMLDCWSRVYRERGVRCLQHSIRHDDVNGTVSYVNDDTSSVCFHDDEEAEESVRKFVASFVKRGTTKQKSRRNRSSVTQTELKRNMER